MALSSDYVYNFALKLIRKNQSGGFNATEFGFHWSDAQNSYQDDLLGRFQNRSNGKSGTNTGLIQDQTILTKLLPFTISASLGVAAGRATKPGDFIYQLALRVGNYKVVEVNHDQLWAMQDDVIDPPSIADNCYYYTEFQNYYQLYPSAVVSVDLDYIKTPDPVSWKYTFAGSGQQIYDGPSSSQPLWDNNSCMEITKRMLTTIGVSFKDNDFEQFGKSVQLTGE